MKKLIAQFMKFGVVGVIAFVIDYGLLINNGCMWAGVELLSVHYLITKIVATAIVMVWNFVTRKIFLDGGDSSEANAESK